MNIIHGLAVAAVTVAIGLSDAAFADDVCTGYGPQTPRDIGSKAGTNPRAFTVAPAAAKMNLCNIHFHTGAEHKGPGYSVFAWAGEHGGYTCNDTPKLTNAELEDPSKGRGACQGVKPGSTIEVHWVYTSCDVKPGEGLGACSSKQCANPQLRVEAQVFLLTGGSSAADFSAYSYGGHVVDKLHQAKAMPSGSGEPVVFLGSTTGPSYTEEKCSPLQVTWSVRPACTKLNIGTLHKWCESNVFKENHAHGVRQLVTSPALLAPIQ